MRFFIHGTKIVERDGAPALEPSLFLYDNETSAIWREDGTRAVPIDQSVRPVAHVFSPESPARKTAIDVLKIQLGLGCNYSCGYCLQRDYALSDTASVELLDGFIGNVLANVPHPPKKVEFWGGEPLVYWKALRPLGERLRALWPHTELSMITNGSLLTDEIVDWIDRLDVGVGMSHDGPGQAVRGADPLDDPKVGPVIRRLFDLRAPLGRFSINVTLSKGNVSRAAIQRFLEERLGAEHLHISDGRMVWVHDDRSDAAAKLTLAERYEFRNRTLLETRTRAADKFMAVTPRLLEWVRSFERGRRADTIGARCDMANENVLAVDMKGRVVTCHNVSAGSRSENGRSHHIGDLSDLAAVRLDTGVHWRQRANCAGCPILQVCRGACLFLQSDHFEQTCSNAYDDHIPFFALAFELATGFLPYAIEAEDRSLPKDRAFLWTEELPR